METSTQPCRSAEDKIGLDELAELVAMRVEYNFPKVVAKRVIIELFAEISAQVSEGKAVNVQGFGQFFPYLREERVSALRNHKGKIPKRRVPKFKPGSTFLRKVSQED